MSDVVVVGGGITGLAAARDLAIAGARVTLVEPEQLGGRLRTSSFAGGMLDESADAFLARVPDGVELCRELGIEGDLVAPAARRAYVWSHGALRPLPESHMLGVPTDLDVLAASGIVSEAGLEAARRDLTDPLLAPEGDVAIGAFIRQRLGDEVAERLVDPLVGGINAGDTDQLSLAATTPQLDAAARSGAASLMEACATQRAAADPSAPIFFAPHGGMAALVDAAADDAMRHGLDVLPGRAVGLERERGSWRLAIEGGRALEADAVVIAAPANVAAGLLRPHAARVATLLAAIPYASVAMVSLAVPRGSIDRELDGTGYLIPRAEGRTVTACSWASSKWAHLGDEDHAWLRASVGRDGDDSALALGDDALVAAVLADLADTMALEGDPTAVRVNRWPASLPQYRPDHLERVATIEEELRAVAPTIAVTGAAFRGLGIPACIRQGRAAARQVAERSSGT